MTKERKSTVNDVAKNSSGDEKPSRPADPAKVSEHGGREGPDPARYGDWEVDGKCVDF